MRDTRGSSTRDKRGRTRVTLAPPGIYPGQSRSVHIPFHFQTERRQMMKIFLPPWDHTFLMAAAEVAVAEDIVEMATFMEHPLSSILSPSRVGTPLTTFSLVDDLVLSRLVRWSQYKSSMCPPSLPLIPAAAIAIAPLQSLPTRSTSHQTTRQTSPG